MKVTFIIDKLVFFSVLITTIIKCMKFGVVESFDGILCVVFAARIIYTDGVVKKKEETIEAFQFFVKEIVPGLLSKKINDYLYVKQEDEKRE